MSWIFSQIRQESSNAFENAIFEIISQINIPSNKNNESSHVFFNFDKNNNGSNKQFTELIYNKIFLACSPDVYSLLSLLYKKNAWPPLGVGGIEEFGYKTVPEGVELIIYVTRPTFESTDILRSQIFHDFSIDADESKGLLENNSIITSASKTIGMAFDYSSTAGTNKPSYAAAIISIPYISPSFNDLLFLKIGEHFNIKHLQEATYTGLIENRNKNEVRELLCINCELYWSPVDDEVITMEMQEAFSDFYIYNDSILPKIATESIMKLQTSVLKASIGKIRALGEAGKLIAEMLLNLRKKKTECVKNRLTKTNNTDNLSAVPIRFQASLDQSDTLKYDKNALLLYNISSKINQLVIFDRRIDYYSLLCTPSTYLGLIDLFWGIQQEYVTIPEKLVRSGPEKNFLPDWVQGYESLFKSSSNKSTVSLSYSSGLCNEIRDLGYDEIGDYLHKKANELQKMYQEKEDMKTITEMTKFMNKFKNLQREHSSLATHINIASHLTSIIDNTFYQKILKIEYDITQAKFDRHNTGILRVISNKQTVNDLLDQIEELINLRANLTDIYRLLSLLTLVYPSFYEKDLQGIKKGIIQQYGFGEYFRLNNLISVGLLKYADPDFNLINKNKIGTSHFSSERDSHQWEFLCNKLNLIIEPETSKNDLIFYFSGYVPLTVRLLQTLQILPQGWKDMKESLVYIDGSATQMELDELKTEKEETKNSPIGKFEQLKDTVKQIRGSFNKTKEKNDSEEELGITLVFYYGGVTYSEIAAIRRLNKMKNQKERYIILTTSIINADKMYRQLNKETI